LRVARSTGYDWVSQGFIPHIKLAGSVRFRPSETATWLDKQAKPGRASRVPEVLVWGQNTKAGSATLPAQEMGIGDSSKSPVQQRNQ
jgi:hypothetical protein